MEDQMRTDDQLQGQEAESRPVCLQLHLADSIYLWACGEKADNEESYPKLSDKLIGWLILLVQGFAYAMLIALAGDTTYSNTGLGYDADARARAGTVVVSIAGAMYLLIVSTSHDLRAGFSLLVGGSCAGDRAFGASLLIMYGLMICSALTVLASTSDDSASLVLNAVAVLFIADLDEKALKFFSTITHNWRLFWAIEFIGISFSLALIAVSSIGDGFAVIADGLFIFELYPIWIVWVLNPIILTIGSYRVSASLQSWCESCSAALETTEQGIFRSVVGWACEHLVESTKRTIATFIREPCFYTILGVWILQGVITGWFRILSFRVPTGFSFCIGQEQPINTCITAYTRTFALANAMLTAGIVMKIMGLCLRRHAGVSAFQEPRRSAGAVENLNTSCRCATESRVPSLLVGLGMGYWANILLVFLAFASSKGGKGDGSMTGTVWSYIILTGFASVSICMVVDPNILGATFGGFIKPAVDLLLDRSGILFWAMVAVFRDAFMIWLAFIVLASLTYR